MRIFKYRAVDNKNWVNCNREKLIHLTFDLKYIDNNILKELYLFLRRIVFQVQDCFGFKNVELFCDFLLVDSKGCGLICLFGASRPTREFFTHMETSCDLSRFDSVLTPRNVILSTDIWHNGFGENDSKLLLNYY